MKFTILFTLFALSFSSSLIAQGNFSIVTSHDTYQALENSDVLHELPWENETFKLCIPFEFQFLYQPFDQVSIRDGKLSFDNNNWISPFGGVDLEDKGNITAAFTSESPISSIIVNELGLQILKIEFKNVGFYNGSYSDVANFQVWLYSNNAIEFRYGNNQVSSPSSTFDKFSGPIIGVFNKSDNGLEGFQILGSNNFIRKNTLKDNKEFAVDAFQDIPETGMVIHFAPEDNEISAFAKQDQKIEEEDKEDTIKSLPVEPLEGIE
jgi:hypothetical protein